MRTRYVGLLCAVLASHPAIGAAQQVPHNGSFFGPQREVFEPFAIFVANEGVALSLDGSSLLIFDALFRDGVEGYQTIPSERRDRFEGALPFDGLPILAVASHHHPDHYDAAAVAAHLTANPTSRFVSTPIALDLLVALDPDADVLSRASASYPDENEREHHDFGSIRLQTLNLHHGRARPAIQNLGHLVEAGGIRVLHMGDTEVTVEEILAQGIAADEIDFAFVPYWLLLGEDGSRVVQAIGARRVFAIHIPREDVDRSWWGEQGSRGRTIETLERLDGVTALHEPGTRFELDDGH